MGPYYSGQYFPAGMPGKRRRLSPCQCLFFTILAVAMAGIVLAGTGQLPLEINGDQLFGDDKKDDTGDGDYTYEDTSSRSDSYSSSGSGSAQDPWDQAVSRAQSTLSSHPNFVSHLQSYPSTASTINGYIGSLESARSTLDAIDNLKNQDIMLVGNAWDLLIEGLDLAYPGAGTALEALDGQLRQLLAFKDAVNGLNGMGSVAQAAQNFRNNPSKSTLQALNNECRSASGKLSGVSSELSGLMSTLDSTISGVDRIQQAIQLVDSATRNIPGLSDALRQLNQMVSTLAQPLRNIRSTGQTLQSTLREDIGVMNDIQNAVP